MDPLFTKLNYKERPGIYILNQPEMFEPILASVSKDIPIKTEIHWRVSWHAEVMQICSATKPRFIFTLPNAGNVQVD
ncbi:MAG: hypothetical protein WCJ61_03915 [Paludibacter sp.]